MPVRTGAGYDHRRHRGIRFGAGDSSDGLSGERRWLSLAARNWRVRSASVTCGAGRMCRRVRPSSAPTCRHMASASSACGPRDGREGTVSAAPADSAGGLHARRQAV